MLRTENKIIMKKVLQLVTLAGFVSLAACKKDDDDDPKPVPTQPSAKVMFVNGCVSADSLRVSINDTIQTNIPRVGFLSNTGYVNVAPRTTAVVKYLLQNSNVQLASTNMSLAVNVNYSVFSGGIVTSPFMISTTDNLNAPSAGKAKVRFAHLSGDNLNEVVYVGTVRIDSNITSQKVTPFVEVDGGTIVNVIAQDPSNIPSVRQLQNQQFVAGKIYTIMLTGTSNGSGNADLRLTMINNN